ncbi:hypothetical protein [Candidatus Borrarchaeum sp.]|uniref:hypothetical protein n=1 Tax=Candidatus Borrarchaeum sp. TaxID=2846742 RepID=UPI00257E2839|nr:hypothetical protein [Candidatus Borrarchaeum sp.]
MNITYPRREILSGIAAVVLSFLLIVGYATSVQAAGAQTPINAYEIPPSTAEPQIDGIIGETEWYVGGEWTEVQLYKGDTTTPAFKINVKFCHNDTDLFIAATYFNSTADNTRLFVAFEVNDTGPTPPDGIIEPDDILDMVISVNGTFSIWDTDWWSPGGIAENDTDALGTNDATDVVTESAGDWSIEISKKLNSGDTNGRDIALSETDTISIFFRVEFDVGATMNYYAGQDAEWNVLTISGAIFPEFPIESSLVFIVATMLAVFVFVVIKKRKE